MSEALVGGALSLFTVRIVRTANNPEWVNFDNT